MALMDFRPQQVREANAIEEKQQVADYDARPPSVVQYPGRQPDRAVSAPASDLATPVLSVYALHESILPEFHLVALRFVMDGLLS
jgi:hypothetical protein